ncbi:MAG: hypothetical protein ACM3XM_08560, partial [Mycobacterium leprae]
MGSATAAHAAVSGEPVVKRPAGFDNPDHGRALPGGGARWFAAWVWFRAGDGSGGGCRNRCGIRGGRGERAGAAALEDMYVQGGGMLMAV